VYSDAVNLRSHCCLVQRVADLTLGLNDSDNGSDQRASTYWNEIRHQHIINHHLHTSVSGLATGGEWSQLCGNDEDSSPGENGVHHLHCVCLLLEPIHRRVAVRQIRQSPATCPPVHVHAGARACQSQFCDLQPEQPNFSCRLPTSRLACRGSMLSSNVTEQRQRCQ